MFLDWHGCVCNPNNLMSMCQNWVVSKSDQRQHHNHAPLPPKPQNLIRLAVAQMDTWPNLSTRRWEGGSAGCEIADAVNLHHQRTALAGSLGGFIFGLELQEYCAFQWFPVFC